jgi:hypothetical protein
MTDLSPAVRRDWSVEELRVLTAIYFAQDFSIGDDARDECRALGDCFGRTPSSIDRQWRNLDAIYNGKKNFNVGRLVKQTLDDYLANPNGVRQIALDTCERMGWPVSDLILGNRQSVVEPRAGQSEIDDVKKEFFFLLDHLQFKVFSSGSQGYYVQGKLKLLSGKRFQAQSTATLIGSKANLTVTVLASRDQMIEALSLRIGELQPKAFKTGRVGYYGNFKIQLGSEKFQVALMAVEIQGN